MSEHKLTNDKKEQKQIDAIYWGGVLIWAGLVFWLDSLGYLPEIGRAEAWSWIFLGAGVYGLLGSLVRQVSPTLTNPEGKDYAWPGIFLIIGLGGFTNWAITWPLIVILVGVVILGGALLGRR